MDRQRRGAPRALRSPPPLSLGNARNVSGPAFWKSGPVSLEDCLQPSIRFRGRGRRPVLSPRLSRFKAPMGPWGDLGASPALEHGSGRSGGAAGPVSCLFSPAIRGLGLYGLVHGGLRSVPAVPWWLWRWCSCGPLRPVVWHVSALLRRGDRSPGRTPQGRRPGQRTRGASMSSPGLRARRVSRPTRRHDHGDGGGTGGRHLAGGHEVLRSGRWGGVDFGAGSARNRAISALGGKAEKCALPPFFWLWGGPHTRARDKRRGVDLYVF